MLTMGMVSVAADVLGRAVAVTVFTTVKGPKPASGPLDPRGLAPPLIGTTEYVALGASTSGTASRGSFKGKDWQSVKSDAASRMRTERRRCILTTTRGTCSRQCNAVVAGVSRRGSRDEEGQMAQAWKRIIAAFYLRAGERLQFGWLGALGLRV